MHNFALITMDEGWWIFLQVEGVYFYLRNCSQTQIFFYLSVNLKIFIVEDLGGGAKLTVRFLPAKRWSCEGDIISKN